MYIYCINRNNSLNFDWIAKLKKNSILFKWCTFEIVFLQLDNFIYIQEWWFLSICFYCKNIQNLQLLFLFKCCILLYFVYFSIYLFSKLILFIIINSDNYHLDQIIFDSCKFFIAWNLSSITLFKIWYLYLCTWNIKHAMTWYDT